MLIISLFSGIGGFEEAATEVGWDIGVSCEINSFGSHILKDKYPHAYHHDDIHTLTFDKINEELTKRKGTRWRTDELVLVGGFP